MTIYYVATNGSNSANGSSASPWKTISYAMQRDLKAGDTVIVRAGTYNEAVMIERRGRWRLRHAPAKAMSAGAKAPVAQPVEQLFRK